LPQYTATASAPCSTPAGGGSEEDEEEAEEEGEEEGEEEEVDEEAAGRDPEAAAAARAEVQRLLEEYFKLDYEDVVGGIPTRFR
jgi:protein KRI1